MEGRQKLKTLCETRWTSRADALRTFKNAYRVVFHALYQEAVTLADEYQIYPTVPRQAARQRNRANYGVQDPSRYWKVSFFYVFVDHLLQEMDTRVLKNEERFQAQ
ncbi:uncharacterized protein LOC128227201 [Mya arenaria]|uniref:uncharacterized protein LOC128227201 n=1 Tax=Mya arenaria TaxID=6604 RepID=UPI0022E6A841|nr:uncharacterized protein LOC128227201 [Mya arenaria]